MSGLQPVSSQLRAGLIAGVSEAAFRATVVAFSNNFWQLRLRTGSRIPDGPCFIYGNHSNNYDPFIINAFTDWGHSTAGVMTAEYLDEHALAPLFSSVGILGTRKSVPEPGLIRNIYRLLNQSRSVVIYPEGGRRWDGRPAPWIPATAKLFKSAGVPVYPILTHGSYVGWPRWAKYPRPARIELEVLPPVKLSKTMSLESALDVLKRPIAADENTVDEALRPRTAFRPAVGLERLLYRDPFTGEPGGLKVASGTTVTCRRGAWTSTVLPDSRIVDRASGEVFLTGDLYEKVRSFPPDFSGNGPAFSSVVRAVGRFRGKTVDEKHARLSLFQSHVYLEGHNKYHVPIEEIRFASTERSSRLYVTLSSGYLYLHFPPPGSPLMWLDELIRSAPDIRT